MNAKRTDAQWQTIDPTSLSGEQITTYADYKEAYREMKTKREAFETSMQAGVSEGSRMILGYNFGKLSAAIVPDDRKPKAAKATTQSLAEFLVAQANSGRRS